MKLLFDPDGCSGADACDHDHQCVDAWEEMFAEVGDGVEPREGVERDDGSVVVEVPGDDAAEAELAERLCPTHAITVVE